MKFNLLYNNCLDRLGNLLYEKKKVKGTTVVSDPDTGISVSDEENYVYDKLKEKYGAKDIDKQFKDKETFPWNADFYIKSENMIIEYRSHWTHGRKKYNAEDPKHQEEVDWLKSKNNEFYDRTIDTWTRLDPEKEETAIKNGYKYVVFYNIDEFEKWFENPSLTYEEYKEPIALKYSDIKTDSYYHNKEQKDRWNDGRDKDSPNEDKVQKHKKDKQEESIYELFESIFDEINHMSEEEQIAEVSSQPASILYIDNPSEKVQLAACNVYGGALKFIMKLYKDGRLQSAPSDEVLKTAILNYPCAIVNLPGSRQTQEFQSLAVELNPNSIYYIWNPTEQTWGEIKKLYPQYFNMLYKNWSENYADRQARKAAGVKK
jgi:hypothetical protein